MKHVVSRDLHAYWDTLRAGRTAPERADIDPAAIRHILAYTFVLEIARSGKPVRARHIDVRLSGTRINALFGRDLQKCAFDRLWSPGAGSTVDAMLNTVLDERAAVVAGASGGPSGLCPVDIEVLLLPLRHYGLTHSRIFGSMVAHDSPGWMGLTPIGPLDLTCFRTLIGGAAMHEPTTPAALDRPAWSDAVSLPEQASRSAMPLRIGRFKVYNGGGEGRAVG